MGWVLFPEKTSLGEKGFAKFQGAHNSNLHYSANVHGSKEQHKTYIKTVLIKITEKNIPAAL